MENIQDTPTKEQTEAAVDAVSTTQALEAAEAAQDAEEPPVYEFPQQLYEHETFEVSPGCPVTLLHITVEANKATLSGGWELVQVFPQGPEVSHILMKRPLTRDPVTNQISPNPMGSFRMAYSNEEVPAPKTQTPSRLITPPGFRKPSKLKRNRKPF